MREVAIIGAGELGGLVAHLVARADLVRSIKLIDPAERVAAGKALDIMQAAPLERFATHVTGSADLFAAAGADIVVIADPAVDGDWFGDQGGAVLRRLRGFSPNAIFVCAASQHCALVDYAVRTLGIARTRVIGSASEALRAGARAIVALEQNASPRDVALSVLGVPPRHVVIAWESATLNGFALTGMLSEPTRRRLSERIAALWPVGPYALAAAAGTVVELLLGRSRRMAICFMAPDDSAGVRSRTAAVPVRLGPAGVVEAVSAQLTGSERIALENAMLI